MPIFAALSHPVFVTSSRVQSLFPLSSPPLSVKRVRWRSAANSGTVGIEASFSVYAFRAGLKPFLHG